MGLQRTPIFSAILPQVLGSGLAPDLHQVQKILWAEAENVTFYQGKIRRRRPGTLVRSYGTDAIRGITQQQDSDGVRWLWAASGGDIERWYGPPAEVIASGQTWFEDENVNHPATFWDMVPYGDWMLLNNSEDLFQVWKPGTGLEALGDAPANPVTILRRQAFVVAVGTGAAKTRISWSNGDIIDEWTAASDNIAGALTIAEFDTPIRAASIMGADTAVYAEDAAALFRYVGQPFYFGYKFLLDGIGAIGKRAVATDGKNNVGVGRNGVWWTDGNSYKYLDEGYLRDELQERVNWDQGSKIVAVRNDMQGTFEFSFPVDGSLFPNEAWAYDPKIGAWSKVPSFSLKDERRLFRRPLLGDLSGDIYLDQDAESGNPLVLKTKPMLKQLQDESGLRDVHFDSTVQEVDLFLKRAEAVQWRLGAAKEPGGTYTYTPWIDAVEGAKTYPVPKSTTGAAVPSGVYHVLEFQSTADDWDIDLQGFLLFGNIEGTKRL